MKASWFVRYACAVCVLALGGCPDKNDDLGPDGDLETDSGISPVGATDDAAALRQDATVTPATDSAVQPRADARVIEDAATHEDASANDAGTDAGEDAGSDAGTDAGPTSPSFAQVYALIVESCVGCHGAGKALDLSTPALALSGLIGVEAQYPACVADGGVSPTRVIAGDADNSLLIAKLEGTQSCGKQMPPKALLEAEKLAVFRAWVEAGASAQ